MINLNSDYKIVQGASINLTTAMSLINLIGDVNAYGANVTVNYVSVIFPEHITKLVNNIPVMSVGNNDFILIKMILPNDPAWFSAHNLLLFTSYFYSSVKDGTTYITYASVDDSIFFDKSVVYPGSIINICITSSCDVSEHFKKEGYLISKIPSDFNQPENGSAYNYLLRFGSKETRYDNTLFFRDHINISYYQYQGAAVQPAFTSEEIIAASEPGGTPKKDPGNTEVINQFKSIEAYLDSVFTTGKNLLYPYLSVFTDPPVNYAIQSFYRSINLPKPINAQANNTRENYFMSELINIEDSPDLYLYLLFANQNATGAALTSNIQIYNGDPSHASIQNGLITTSPDLPSFTEENYPFVSHVELSQYSDYGIASFNMSEIVNSNPGIENLLVVERFCYNPGNINYTIYNLCTTSVVYTGTALTQADSEYLKKNYPEIDLSNAYFSSGNE
jgi:hypothetical protein